MRLYILRHAIAVPRGTTDYPNDDRPLIEEGIRKMKKAASGLARVVPTLDAILTSPLQRAQETALIAAEALKQEDKVIVTQGLSPGGDPDRVLKTLARFDNTCAVMIVGHEPDLSSFASSLLGSSTTLLELKKGALCRIDCDQIPPRGPGRLVFLIQPKHLRALATT
jgi:phosphohistidine phosphatase